MATMNPLFRAKAKSGELIFEDKEGLRNYLQRFSPDKELVVTVRQEKSARSNNQNRYYWLILGLIADELGDDAEYYHDYFKRKFLCIGEKKVIDEVIKITRSTTDLSTSEMEDYLAKIRQFCSLELSIVIPLPNEVEIN